MKDGLRFVDCDMHIMERPDLFEHYLDPPRSGSRLADTGRLDFAIERNYDAADTAAAKNPRTGGRPAARP